MTPNLLHVLHLMREARATALEDGVAVAFPFRANDVAAIHTFSHRHGPGLYFRLKDGRVFSAFGVDLDPNPACYDAGDRRYPWLDGIDESRSWTFLE